MRIRASHLKYGDEIRLAKMQFRVSFTKNVITEKGAFTVIVPQGFGIRNVLTVPFDYKVRCISRHCLTKGDTISVNAGIGG